MALHSPPDPACSPRMQPTGRAHAAHARAVLRLLRFTHTPTHALPAHLGVLLGHGGLPSQVMLLAVALGPVLGALALLRLVLVLHRERGTRGGSGKLVRSVVAAPFGGGAAPARHHAVRMRAL